MILPNNFPKEDLDKLKEMVRIPEGTFTLEIQLNGLHTMKGKDARIIEIGTGKIVYILEKDIEQNINFYHASPGTGTRKASVNIDQFKPNEVLFMCMTWSPVEIFLHIGIPRTEPLISSKGEVSQKKFGVASDSSIVQYGDDGANILQIDVYAGGKLYFKNSAIESWSNVIDATKVLMEATPPEGEIRYESVAVNMVIVMLVTGYESYCKSRFLELEEEGIKVHFDSLSRAFLSKTERENNIVDTIKEDARLEGITPTQKFIAQGRVDFQNYKRSKAAFKKAFGISFSNDLRISNSVLEDIQNLIKVRHRIVHVSLFTSAFNIEQHGSELVFPTFAFANNAIEIIDVFVRRIHEQSLLVYKKSIL